MSYDDITYSDKYYDEKYEYRHVLLPSKIAKQVPKNHLLTETEWRNLGVQQSPGWIHYMVHAPERHVLLFRRPLSKPADQNSLGQPESVALQTLDVSENQENLVFDYFFNILYTDCQKSGHMHLGYNVRQIRGFNCGWSPYPTYPLTQQTPIPCSR